MENPSLDQLAQTRRIIGAAPSEIEGVKEEEEGLPHLHCSLPLLTQVTGYFYQPAPHTHTHAHAAEKEQIHL